MTWQLQEAKSKFSELVRMALTDGPQVVTRHGREVVVMLSSKEYRQLTDERPNFKEFLMSAPDVGELETHRDTNPPREVELDADS